MVYEKILCPYCRSDDVVKYGKNSTRKQIMLFHKNGISDRMFTKMRGTSSFEGAGQQNVL